MEKVALNIKEVSEVLGVSRTTVYELMHREDFPAFKIGARTLVPREKLIEWVNKQEKNFK